MGESAGMAVSSRLLENKSSMRRDSFFWISCGILLLRLILEIRSGLKWMIGLRDRRVSPVEVLAKDLEPPAPKQSPIRIIRKLSTRKPSTNYLETLGPEDFEQFIK
jgi:hypothetical protein